MHVCSLMSLVMDISPFFHEKVTLFELLTLRPCSCPVARTIAVRNRGSEAGRDVDLPLETGFVFGVWLDYS